MYLFDIALEDGDFYGSSEVTAKDLLNLELAAEEVRVAESDAKELISAIDRSGMIVDASEARVSTMRSISSTKVDSTIATLAVESLRDTANALGYKAIDKNMLVSMEEAKENDPYTTLATALEEEKGMVRKAKDFLVGLLKKVIAKIKTLGLKLAKAVTASVKSFENLNDDIMKLKIGEFKLDNSEKTELKSRFGVALSAGDRFIQTSVDVISNKMNVDESKNMKSLFELIVVSGKIPSMESKDDAASSKALVVVPQQEEDKVSKAQDKNDVNTIKSFKYGMSDNDIKDLVYYRISRIDNSYINLLGVEKNNNKLGMTYRNIKVDPKGAKIEKIKVFAILDAVKEGIVISKNFDKFLDNVNAIAKEGDKLIKSESGEGKDSIKKDFISCYSKYTLDSAVGAYKTLNNIKWLANLAVKKNNKKNSDK